MPLVPIIKADFHRSLFSGTVPKFITAGLTSAAFLTAAYTVSWLGWLAWIAFVPYILAVRGQKRRHTYLTTAVMFLPVLLLIVYLTDLSGIYDFMFLFHFLKQLSYMAIGGTILAVIILTSEIQYAGRYLGNWGCIIQPVIWTGILVLLNVLSPTAGSLFSSVLGVIPVSQTIFQSLAGTYGMYVLFFAVLAVNGITAGILEWDDGKKKYLLLASIIAGILACGLLGGPVRSIPSSPPEAQGVDPKILADMEKTIRAEFPQIRSIILVRHGYTVYEEYYHGCTPYSLVETCSVTKSFTGALTGIAIDKGYVKSVDQKALEFFPELSKDGLDPKAGGISIKNILTLKTGLDWSDPFFAGEMCHSPNWIEYAFKHPVLIDPDRFFNYNSGAVHILSGIINQSSGLTGTQFADRYLFGPLGISGYVWVTDPQGNPYGGAQLFMKSRDMAKFGYLYLREGKWNGRQVISSRWIQDSARAYSDGGEPECEKYGYLFWIKDVKGHKAYFAAGFGGEFIYVVPDLDLVAVIGSDAYDPHPENRKLLSDYIIPSATSLR